MANHQLRSTPPSSPCSALLEVAQNVSQAEIFQVVEDEDHGRLVLLFSRKKGDFSIILLVLWIIIVRRALYILINVEG